MSSLGVIQGEAAGQQPTGSTSRLEGLPVEALIEVLSHADFEAFDNMRLASRRLRSIIHLHFCKILPGILEREFSPAKAFFDALGDIHLPDGVGCPQLLAGSKTGILPLLGLCRTIKRWETEFSLLRFANAPEHTRSLRPHERCRLRYGLYFWWRFARCFHGPAPCSDHLNSSVTRRAFVRQLTITRLHEVWDTWETIRKGVGRMVCPARSAVRERIGGGLRTEGEALRVGWGDDTENADILGTMMKLRPDEILHLLVYRHRYATKQSVTRFVRSRHPRIEDSVEGFTQAILDVVLERNMSIFWPFPCVGFPSLDGGILDYKEPKTERLRAVHSNDYGQWARDAMAAWRRPEPSSAAPRVGRLETSS